MRFEREVVQEDERGRIDEYLHRPPPSHTPSISNDTSPYSLKLHSPLIWKECSGTVVAMDQPHHQQVEINIICALPTLATSVHTIPIRMGDTSQFNTEIEGDGDVDMEHHHPPHDDMPYNHSACPRRVVGIISDDPPAAPSILTQKRTSALQRPGIVPLRIRKDVEGAEVRLVECQSKAWSEGHEFWCTGKGEDERLLSQSTTSTPCLLQGFEENS